MALLQLLHTAVQLVQHQTEPETPGEGGETLTWSFTPSLYGATA